MTLIGEKIGMMQVYSEDGLPIPCTVVKAGPCYVIGKRIPEKNGYYSIRVSYGEVKKKKLSRPLLGELKTVFGDRESYPARVIKEFRVDPDFGEKFDVGDVIPIDVISEGEKVDITGITKGKGFQGVMKRWGFSGGRASHGSKFHRKPGSIGQLTPRRIWKGKKMPGHMGNKKKTVQNLRVVKIIKEDNLLLVKGAVQGIRGGIVYIRRKNS